MQDGEGSTTVLASEDSGSLQICVVSNSVQSGEDGLSLLWNVISYHLDVYGISLASCSSWKLINCRGWYAARS